MQRLLRTRTVLTSCFFALGVMVLPASAQTPVQALPVVDSQRTDIPISIPAPPAIDGKAWILMDAASGKVITEHASDTPLPPASLTKLMTAYLIEREIAAGHVSPDDEVLISKKAWQTGGSKMFIEVGKRISVDDLMHGIVVVSGNDASVAMAEHLAGGEDVFAAMMTQQARKLGMQNSQFRNATGLPDEGHYSSARDMALLAQHIINDYPEHYAMYSQREFTFNGIRQHNRNRLLWRDDTVDGLKTGWTQEAGYGLVASARRDGMRLIGVVFGARSAESRSNEVSKLLNYGFRYYQTVALADAGAPLVQARVWKGQADTVHAGLADTAFITLPRGREAALTREVVMNENIEAPIARGETLGTLELRLEDEVIASRALVALSAVEQAGFFKCLVDRVRRFFVTLFD